MSSVEASLDFLRDHPDFEVLQDGDGFKIDLRYASSNNFVGYDMYGPFRSAILHKVAARKLYQALEFLRSEHPGYSFIIFDALRPRSVQRILWKFVVGTEGEKYIANPDNGSLHNFGFAVDLSVLDASGCELDMGAGYDDFRPIAQPQLEQQFLQSGELSRAQVDNRLILRRCMERAGFAQLAHEWWHFDALPKAEVKSQFQIVE